MYFTAGSSLLSVVMPPSRSYQPTYLAARPSWTYCESSMHNSPYSNTLTLLYSTLHTLHHLFQIPRILGVAE